jgi:protein-S-isoprenylcysteine O-methyltransferase Ste14
MLALLYGIVAYIGFLLVYLYAIGFVGDLVVPRTVDRGGPPTPAGTAFAIDVALLLAFGLQHSVMARPAFKRWWTSFVPQHVERSTFVAFSCLALALIYWQWRPIPEVVWHVDAPAGRAVLWTLFAAGWLVVVASSFAIDHFDLFGLRQVFFHARGRAYEAPRFEIRFPYSHVRHPLMLGFLVSFWCAPTMTQGHLLFAAVTTFYIAAALVLEERDLLRHHGDSYADYRRKVSMLLPLPRRPR